MLRTGWVALAAIATTGYYAAVILLTSVVPAWRQRRCGYWAQGWSAVILRAAGVTVASNGLDRVDPRRSQIVVCNHQSWFDVLALFAAFPTSLRFVAKEELRSVPVFGKAILRCGHIAIDRRNRRSAIESLQRAARRLRERTLHVVMFAEGTRSPTGELQPFKKGAFVLALETRTPVLPVAVVGSRAVMPKHSYAIRSGEIEVRVGEPIEVGDLTMSDRNALRDRARQAVADLMSGPSPGQASGALASPPAPAAPATGPDVKEEQPCPRSRK